MKTYILILPLILIFSCAKAPEPANAKALNSPLETPEEFNRLGLSLKKKYESGSELFNFFFWPSGLGREELAKIATDVSEIGIQIEEKYKSVDVISFNKSKVYKKMTELEEKRDSKLLELYKEYGCSKNEGGGSCLDVRDEASVIYPEYCDQLEDKPWSNEALAKECSLKEEEINEHFEEEALPIQEELLVFEDAIDQELIGITARADAITDLLENGNKKSEEWVNWMQTKEANIEFIDGVPQITLKIMFNNSLEGVANRYLYYKSKDQGDIVDLEHVMDGSIPNLKFKLLEKRATRVEGQNLEERTGNYYLVDLKQTELDYGLEFLGEVERFNAAGKSWGKGMMKIYIKRKY